MTRIRTWLGLCLVGTILMGCGRSVAPRQPMPNGPSPSREPSADQGRMGPMLDHMSPPMPDLSPLARSIEHYMVGRGKHYSIYIEDVATGATVAVNERTQVAAASVNRLPVNVYLYQLAYRGMINLNEEIALSQPNTRWQGRVSLRNLAKASLHENSQVATSSLIKRLGTSEINGFVSDLGATATAIEQSMTSARDVGLLLRLVLAISRENSQLGAELITNLSDTTNQPIRSAIPENIMVAQISGDENDYHNAVGVVFVPSRTYTIAVLLQDPAGGRAGETIAAIAASTYDFFKDLPRVSTPTPP